MKAKINILFEDTHIIVCEKPHGIATQSRSIRNPDMVSILKNHIQQTSGNADPYLAVIHRLDQPVRGILVFAKTPFAAKALNQQLTSGGFGKHYRALVSQCPAASQAVVEDYLVKDGRTNLSKVCAPDTPDAKFARLSYTVVMDEPKLFTPSSKAETELDILLDTGRHHQIRVQLSHLGCPIVGDAKYHPSSGQNRRNICLCAYCLEFLHPKTKKHMQFSLLHSLHEN